MFGLFPFLLVACGGAVGSSAGKSSDVDLSGDGGTRVLADGSVDGQPIVVPDGHRVSLTVEDDRVGGTAACNGYGGSLRVDGRQVSIDRPSATEMGCEPPVMEAERAYPAALPRVTSASRQKDRLTLTGNEVSLVFSLRAPVPTEALVGPSWELDTLLDGDTARSVAGDPAHLLLREDGTMTATTSCRELTGEYQVHGDQVQVTTLSAHGECPSALRDQDGHVIAVLEGGFRATVDGRRLVLHSDRSQGLGYRTD